ncbi:hypothetical protein G7K_1284-t1 [Saitoella complicata NRRL Y-17804]|uniref:Kinase n=2 Tax=Saitoella complicata (strain BCRC 22490 / CBS 7301 / JCM 7358 / NBRC 10748 / NRRL Y-17804) TaxID=698492 RepID=A0A0E9NB16_SAICN|nr:hypothetical protein G7K_1284-t1 [Saitoella complicata NRRL Y-17804]
MEDRQQQQRPQLQERQYTYSVLSHASPFESQVAGHEGLLEDDTGLLLIKPCTKTEVRFYDESVNHPELREWMPAYMGSLQLGLPENVSREMIPEEASIPAIEDDKGGGGRPNKKLEQAVVLENLTNGFKRPCVMDIKLGSRLWADDATPEKQARMEQVSRNTTSGVMGMRITGMRVWRAEQCSFEVFPKSYGKSLTALTLPAALRQFFSARLLPTQTPLILSRFVEDVELIIAALNEEELRMFSCSLLFIYEGDAGALSEAIAEEAKKVINEELYPPSDSEGTHSEEEIEEDEEEEIKKVIELRLIDFAHAKWLPGAGRDDNIFRGAKNVLYLLRDVLAEVEAEDLAEEIEGFA